MDRFAEFINLVTLSGFLLAMGISLGLSSGKARRLWGCIRPVLLLLLVACGLCFASTYPVMDHGWPLTATFLGTTQFASVPLLPYLPWFPVGIYLGRAGGN